MLREHATALLALWLALVGGASHAPRAVANLIFSDSGTTAPLRGAAASRVARGTGHPAHKPSAENLALAGAAAFETAEECHVQHHAGYGSFVSGLLPTHPKTLPGFSQGVYSSTPGRCGPTTGTSTCLDGSVTDARAYAQSRLRLLQLRPLSSSAARHPGSPRRLRRVGCGFGGPPRGSGRPMERRSVRIGARRWPSGPVGGVLLLSRAARRGTWHADGHAFTWGMSFRTADAGECCAACRAHRHVCSSGGAPPQGRLFFHASGMKGPTDCGAEAGRTADFVCNAWVFCPSALCWCVVSASCCAAGDGRGARAARGGVGQGRWSGTRWGRAGGLERHAVG
jgi:hypothetical protein